MRIAVLGAGYAGLTLARRLERTLPTDVDLTVVDDTGDHLVQHELHRVVRRPSLAEGITVPLCNVLDRAEIVEARVTGVDPDAKRVSLAGRPPLSYDVAAVCLGAVTNFFDLPGVAEHATPLKRVPHARTIRADFLDVLDGGGRTVVGGAGLSGVQVAGELVELAREADADAEIVLLEREDEVIPGFPPEFRRAVRDELVERGVSVQTDRTVVGATEDAVRLGEGSELRYDQLIWTGGICGPTALNGHRPLVRDTLAVDDRRTFVVGDAARIVDADGEAVPASSQSAIRAARAVARSITSIVEYERNGGLFEPRPEPFVFDSPGWLVSVGDGAVGLVGGQVVRGPPALALKATVGGGYLSSVGAVTNAVELVYEELGIG